MPDPNQEELKAIMRSLEAIEARVARQQWMITLCLIGLGLIALKLFYPRAFDAISLGAIAIAVVVAVMLLIYGVIGILEVFSRARSGDRIAGEEKS